MKYPFRTITQGYPKMALTRVGAGRNLIFIIYSSATCLKQNFIYSCDIPNERVWPLLASELFKLLFDCPYVDKMAHFNIYLRIRKNMTKRTKILCQLLIWHTFNRHRTLSLYLMVFCNSTPVLWYYHYLELRYSWLNMNGVWHPNWKYTTTVIATTCYIHHTCTTSPPYHAHNLTTPTFSEA